MPHPPRSAFAAPLGLALLMLGAGCDAEPVPQPSPDPAELATVATRVDDVITPATPGHQDREAIPLHVQLIDLPADGRSMVHPDDTVAILITNDSDVAGLVALDLEQLSESGRAREAVATADIAAHGSATVKLRASMLGLGHTPTGLPGRLSLRARLAGDAGRGFTSAPHSLGFHTHGDGWTLYGPDARQDLLSDGALPSEVKAELRAVLEQGPGTITLPNGVVLPTAAPTLTAVVHDTTDEHIAG